ncbi:MAG: hypothetical protein ACP5N1_06505 [Candidatus Woesearchaeota archaeon]
MGIFRFFINDDFSKYNLILHKQFGEDAVTSRFNLKIVDGFFICPDDKLNHNNSSKHLIIEQSIIEVFSKKYPLIYENVKLFYNLTEGFDRLDWDRFKYGAKLHYFFAVSYYVYYNKLTRLDNIKYLYKEKIIRIIEKDMSFYIQGFIKLANERKVNNRLFSLFTLAVDIIMETSKKLKIPFDFNKLSYFMISKYYNPYNSLSGPAFEEEVKNILLANNDSTSYFNNLIENYLGESGLLILLDSDKQFMRLADLRAVGVSIPDYLFVTSTRIIPIDLKINLLFAEKKQVSRENLIILFKKTDNKINALFKGFTIENQLIE